MKRTVLYEFDRNDLKEEYGCIYGRMGLEGKSCTLFVPNSPGDGIVESFDRTADFRRRVLSSGVVYTELSSEARDELLGVAKDGESDSYRDIVLRMGAIVLKSDRVEKLSEMLEMDS